MGSVDRGSSAGAVVRFFASVVLGVHRHGDVARPRLSVVDGLSLRTSSRIHAKTHAGTRTERSEMITKNPATRAARKDASFKSKKRHDTLLKWGISCAILPALRQGRADASCVRYLRFFFPCLIKKKYSGLVSAFVLGASSCVHMADDSRHRVGDMADHPVHRRDHLHDLQFLRFSLSRHGLLPHRRLLPVLLVVCLFFFFPTVAN